MKITLYNGSSIDGFVAKNDGDTDWVADSKAFEQKCKEAGCVFIGRKTYDFDYDYFKEIKDFFIIVLTSEKDREPKQENVVFVNSVEEAVEKAQEKGFENVILGGGGGVNFSFLDAQLVDEIILSVHPLILGKGIKLFEGYEVHVKLELTDVNKLSEGLVHLKYNVKKE